MPLTARQMIPALGAPVLVRFESLAIACTVKDVKHVYGTARLLIVPVSGSGEQWVTLERVTVLHHQPPAQPQPVLARRY